MSWEIMIAKFTDMALCYQPFEITETSLEEWDGHV